MKYSVSSLVLISCATVVFAAGSALAGPCDVTLNVDSAPNVYGSPDFGPWWSAAKADVVAGTFTDMRNGTYPGTHDIAPEDEIVYSFGDLGKRIHWIYWVDGTTTAQLNDLFQVKWVVDWDGVDYTYDWNNSALVPDGAETGWVQPGSWTDYSGGVIGSFGFAWEPDTDQTIQELRDSILASQTHLNGYVRIREDVNSAWCEHELGLAMVPLPTPLALAGVGLLGVGGFSLVRRRRYQD